MLIHDSNIDGNKLQIGFTILKQIITTENNSNNNETLIIIWNMLPTCLGSFCCTENSEIIGGDKNTFLYNFNCLISFNYIVIYFSHEFNVLIKFN